MGYGDIYVNCRVYISVEEVGFEEDLIVGNGDYVGWDIGRNVICLCFDDWQGCQ